MKNVVLTCISAVSLITFASPGLGADSQFQSAGDDSQLSQTANDVTHDSADSSYKSNKLQNVHNSEGALHPPSLKVQPFSNEIRIDGFNFSYQSMNGGRDSDSQSWHTRLTTARRVSMKFQVDSLVLRPNFIFNDYTTSSQIAVGYNFSNSPFEIGAGFSLDRDHQWSQDSDGQIKSNHGLKVYGIYKTDLSEKKTIEVEAHGDISLSSQKTIGDHLLLGVECRSYYKLSPQVSLGTAIGANIAKRSMTENWKEETTSRSSFSIYSQLLSIRYEM